MRMPHCPHCGYTVANEHNFCANCGTSLGSDGDHPPTGERDGTPANDSVAAHPHSRSDHSAAETVEESNQEWDDPPLKTVGGTSRKRATLEPSVGLLGLPVVVAIVALFLSASLAVFPEQAIEIAEFENELPVGLIQFVGGAGVLVSLTTIGLVYYYYTFGPLDKRYFWALLGLGLVGLFVASNIFLLALAAVGVYGLYKLW